MSREDKSFTCASKCFPLGDLKDKCYSENHICTFCVCGRNHNKQKIKSIFLSLALMTQVISF